LETAIRVRSTHECCNDARAGAVRSVRITATQLTSPEFPRGNTRSHHRRVCSRGFDRYQSLRNKRYNAA
jgi:hypothetical protein